MAEAIAASGFLNSWPSDVEQIVLPSVGLQCSLGRLPQVPAGRRDVGKQRRRCPRLIDRTGDRRCEWRSRRCHMAAGEMARSTVPRIAAWRRAPGSGDRGDAATAWRWRLRRRCTANPLRGVTELRQSLNTPATASHRKTSPSIRLTPALSARHKSATSSTNFCNGVGGVRGEFRRQNAQRVLFTSQIARAGRTNAQLASNVDLLKRHGWVQRRRLETARDCRRCPRPSAS